MPAFRNIRLCGKDCLCLYVCPSGATDTENSIIDETKCIPGCRACVDACPSGAISMIPVEYPCQQKKTHEVIAALRALGRSKTRQEKIAADLAAADVGTLTRQFAEAIEKSNRLMSEDILRESGYMLPQSGEARELLTKLLENAAPDFPKNAAELLLARLYKSNV